MRTPNHPPLEQISLERVLYALSDPARLDIVKNLANHGEQTCGACNSKAPKSTMSHHFQVLRETGIIRMRPSGTHILNSLRKDDLDQKFPGLMDAVLKALPQDCAN